MKEIFSTSDVNLITFLRFKKHLIVSIDTTGHRRQFVFNDSPRLQEDIARYFNGEKIKISPRDLLLELRMVKNLLYS